jgi:MFS family permease
MPRRNLRLVSFLIASSFVWFYEVQALIRALMPQGATSFESILINGIHYSAIIISGIAGALLSRKISRNNLLIYWMTIGSASSIVPILLPIESTASLAIVALIFGISFGIGMPSCLAFFADSTEYNNRGFASGTTLLVTNFVAFALAFLGGIAPGTPVALTIGILFVLRLVGLSVLLASKLPATQPQTDADSNSFISIFRDRTFIFYAVPWLMFSLINSFEKVFFNVFFDKNFMNLMGIVGPAIGTVVVLIGGILADRMGRKRILIFGFVALGIGYASIGFDPSFTASRDFYSIVDGFAWGIFMVTYMLVLWGDISTMQGGAEKYYALGSIPFFLANLVSLLLVPFTQQIQKASPYTIFSLASFFLFLAVIPLMFAPETLPEKNIKERELKNYFEKAKKVKEKFT